jgi:hypothetical protein
MSSPEPTNDWITDRRPTSADGFGDGYVVVRRHPLGDHTGYLHWSYVGEAVPWRHSDCWRPPATLEHEPTKPALAVGQRWRRRDGKVVTIRVDAFGRFMADGWSYRSDGTAPFLHTGDDARLELIELLPPEPRPTLTPRKFKATPRRTVADFGHTIDAIDEDGVAWWMIVASDDDSEPEWHQLLPLPAKEATP